ncbi:glycosyl hydrolase [Leptodontidium sp. 2 PMI_412]|nr:glycosyl hydrolase [Leptodontidium sp. 2 PMI_412]
MTDQPLVTHIFTADPSAHSFNGKLYVYPSHDIKTDIQDNDNGDQYAMTDYHVLSMDDVGSPVTDHGVALALEDIPWAGKQLWAPDTATKNGKYYLYYPARDKEGVFRIGVAVSDVPEGPFKPEPKPIEGSYSIDPASFVDDDGEAYLYFGGIWGGQLQCWTKGEFDKEAYTNMEATSGHAYNPRVARLSKDMLQFDGGVKELVILGEDGNPIPCHDHDRRFFEAAWMHKYEGKYYFSYSTGDTHYLCYAIGDNPFGPFTYAGRILEPVLGWTTHHSIVEHKGKWYLFHHDASLSEGKNHLRCVKVKEIFYNKDGKIQLTPS